MNDSELLELAAKAAGYAAKEMVYMPGDDFERRYLSVDSEEWNPLEDDGDALRLLVELSIHIEHAGQSGHKADRVQASPRGRGHLAWVEMYESDHHAATRRAIVRAAAEIGKAMP